MDGCRSIRKIFTSRIVVLRTWGAAARIKEKRERARERSSGRGQGYQPQAFKHPSSQPQGHRTRYARASESTSSELSIRASLKG
jgi:hypothetical protein